jgi:hypothetical protein
LVEDIRIWNPATARFCQQGYNVYQFTEFSSPDNWFTSHSANNMDITHRLTVADFTPAELCHANSVSHDGNSNDVEELEHLHHKNMDIQAALERKRKCERQAEDAACRERVQQHEEALRRQAAAQEEARCCCEEAAPDKQAPVRDGEQAFLQIFCDHQTMMLRQNEVLTRALGVINNNGTSGDRNPAIEFPPWDGSKDNIPDFLFGINMMKNDSFFSTVRSWTNFTTGEEQQNNYLLTSITTKVPLSHRSTFANDSRYTTDGFAMLHRLISHLKGETK